MDIPISNIKLLNAIIDLHIISYKIICFDWSWIPMNKKDYQLSCEEKSTHIS